MLFMQDRNDLRPSLRACKSITPHFEEAGIAPCAKAYTTKATKFHEGNPFFLLLPGFPSCSFVNFVVKALNSIVRR
jgi:hypothetical protein